MPPVRAPVGTPVGTAFDASLPWALDGRVTLRPEPFGALAYHFGTRRLSFLNSPMLVAVVERLADEPTARAACGAAGVGPAQLASYEQALGTLAESGMICPRDEPGGPARSEP
ncbi:MAG: mycofactocin biosynthesis chaperone MftB [Acidimicrobiales bacterium]